MISAFFTYLKMYAFHCFAISSVTAIICHNVIIAISAAVVAAIAWFTCQNEIEDVKRLAMFSGRRFDRI